MPKFLEDKLRQEYGNNPHAIYGTMNSIGAMHGNKETVKGQQMEAKHNAKIHPMFSGGVVPMEPEYAKKLDEELAKLNQGPPPVPPNAPVPQGQMVGGMPKVPDPPTTMPDEPAMAPVPPPEPVTEKSPQMAALAAKAMAPPPEPSDDSDADVPVVAENTNLPPKVVPATTAAISPRANAGPSPMPGLAAGAPGGGVNPATTMPATIAYQRVIAKRAADALKPTSKMDVLRTVLGAATTLSPRTQGISKLLLHPPNKAEAAETPLYKAAELERQQQHDMMLGGKQSGQAMNVKLLTEHYFRQGAGSITYDQAYEKALDDMAKSYNTPRTELQAGEYKPDFSGNSPHTGYMRVYYDKREHKWIEQNDVAPPVARTGSTSTHEIKSGDELVPTTSTRAPIVPAGAGGQGAIGPAAATPGAAGAPAGAAPLQGRTIVHPKKFSDNDVKYWADQIQGDSKLSAHLTQDKALHEAVNAELAKRGANINYIDAMTRDSAQYAQSALVHIPEIQQDIKALTDSGDIGLVMSRWNDFLAGKVGIGPQFNRLRSNIGLLDSNVARVHGGARGGSSSDMYERMKGIANASTMEPTTLLTGVDVLKSWLSTYAKMAPQMEQLRVPGEAARQAPGVQAQPSAVQPPADSTGSAPAAAGGSTLGPDKLYHITLTGRNGPKDYAFDNKATADKILTDWRAQGGQ